MKTNSNPTNRPRRGSKLAASPKRSFSDKFWHDKDGNLVVFQAPSAVLVVWAVFFTLSQMIRSEPWQSIFSVIAFAALLMWSIKEAIFGVNYFRRILGATLLILAILVRF